MALARSVVYLDENGFLTIHRISTALGGASIQAGILALSNADYQEVWEGPITTNPSPAPTAAVYLPGNMTALLTYQCADLSEAQIRIPAPQVGIFYADRSTVDPAMIAALNAVAIGNLVSSTGSLATTYLSGKLQPFRQS